MIQYNQSADKDTATEMLTFIPKKLEVVADSKKICIVTACGNKKYDISMRA